jgi:hypothetical protein
MWLLVRLRVLGHRSELRAKWHSLPRSEQGSKGVRLTPLLNEVQFYSNGLRA